MLIEIGRLTQDIELRTVNTNGKEQHVLNNRFAVKISQGESVFFDVVAWNGVATFIAEHFKKGDEMYIEGELRNKLYKFGDREMNITYAQINRVKFTSGNKKLADFV